MKSLIPNSLGQMAADNPTPSSRSTAGSRPPRRPGRSARVPQLAAAGDPLPCCRPYRVCETRSVQGRAATHRDVRPIAGTLAEVYLCRCGLDPSIADTRALRFHPRCYYRDADHAPSRTYPALIAAVTDAPGVLTGAIGPGSIPRAPATRRPSRLGALLGTGVRFGALSGGGPSLLVAHGHARSADDRRPLGEPCPTGSDASMSHSIRTAPVAAARSASADAPARPGSKCSRSALVSGLQRRSPASRPPRPLRNLRHQLVPGDAARFLGAALRTRPAKESEAD